MLFSSISTASGSENSVTSSVAGLLFCCEEDVCSDGVLGLKYSNEMFLMPEPGSLECDFLLQLGVEKLSRLEFDSDAISSASDSSIITPCILSSSTIVEIS